MRLRWDSYLRGVCAMLADGSPCQPSLARTIVLVSRPFRLNIKFEFASEFRTLKGGRATGRSRYWEVALLGGLYMKTTRSARTKLTREQIAIEIRFAA